MKKILIIEDDAAQFMGIKTALEEDNYEAFGERDGETGFQSAMNGAADIIILDINLPSKNGIEICRDLRLNKISTPIIMLTCRKDEIDKVIGLEIGADDYMTKPYSIRELKARIKALLRRPREFNQETVEFSFAEVYVNFTKMEVTKSRRQIELSTTEFNVLKYFILHEGEVLTRYQLLDDVWGYDSEPTTRTVDNYILQLRKKIEDIPSEPVHFLTVHGAGYKFIR